MDGALQIRPDYFWYNACIIKIVHVCNELVGQLKQGLLYRWTEHSADFFKITTGGGKKAPQITPRGWIFWTMIFYNLKKFTSRSI